MKKNISKISYGKNVYDNKEISAVLRTFKNSTQMGQPWAHLKINSKYFLKIWFDGKFWIISINISS